MPHTSALVGFQDGQLLDGEAMAAGHRAKELSGESFTQRIVRLRSLHQGAHDGLPRRDATEEIVALRHGLEMFEHARMARMRDEVGDVRPQRQSPRVGDCGIERDDERAGLEPGHHLVRVGLQFVVLYKINARLGQLADGFCRLLRREADARLHNGPDDGTVEHTRQAAGATNAKLRAGILVPKGRRQFEIEQLAAGVLGELVEIAANGREERGQVGPDIRQRKSEHDPGPLILESAGGGLGGASARQAGGVGGFQQPDVRDFGSRARLQFFGFPGHGRRKSDPRDCDAVAATASSGPKPGP